ncbi:MAG: UbiX family flavin prenyltransferase [Bacteroidales bacterium]|jgi:4-hydroxy-3-polyprenylbenzoate decarboxylase|nr:UbiX family flavin prenyltransferase [Bacteroidales bacterium]
MKIIFAITGASGSIYAKILLEKLHQYRNQLSEVAVIFSQNAELIWKHELGEEPNLFGFMEYANSDFMAPCASGSAGYDAMIVCPCSMGTLGRIAHGVSDNLLLRAADVQLKERKKLIVVTRETPYNLIHIENMKLFHMAGGIVCPANPSFYSCPQSLDEACETVVYRVLSLLGIQHYGYKWGEKK